MKLVSCCLEVFINSLLSSTLWEKLGNFCWFNLGILLLIEFFIWSWVFFLLKGVVLALRDALNWLGFLLASIWCPRLAHAVTMPDLASSFGVVLASSRVTSASPACAYRIWFAVISVISNLKKIKIFKFKKFFAVILNWCFFI